MSEVTDLVEDWIMIRSTLQRQVKLLEAEEPHGAISPEARQATVVRIRAWIVDLNALLKEHSRLE